MALRLEEVCPKCGSHLMVREGENGDFLACPRFPSCKFTKPLPDSDLKIYQKPSPYCEKCSHTGLLPFKNRGGQVVPHAYLFCKCNPQSDEYSNLYPYQYTPEMFDFPMSYSFYRSLCQQHGWPEPSPLEPLEERPSETDTAEPQWNKRQWDTVQQLKAQILFLSDKVNEIRASASKRKPKTYTIK